MLTKEEIKKHNKRQHRINKVIWRRIKKKIMPIIKSILKFIGWAVLFVIILSLAEPNEEIPFWIITTLYIALIINLITDNSNYKSWQQQAKNNDFYNRFCSEWHPSIFWKLFVFWFALKYFEFAGFVSAYLFVYCMDLWDRRYITHNIKHDLILEELSKLKDKK